MKIATNANYNINQTTFGKNNLKTLAAAGLLVLVATGCEKEPSTKEIDQYVSTQQTQAQNNISKIISHGQNGEIRPLHI